jgi:16S rRNA G966 N2-methylase RsmD
MEYNKTAFRCLESNIKNTDPERCTTFYGDSFENFENVYAMVKRTGQKTYFYFDPPFSTRDGMDDIYDKTIALIERIEPEVCEMVTVEHMTNLDMPKELGQLELIKRKSLVAVP